MRIVVNDIAATYGGGLSILQQFYQYVVENDRENEWIFLLGDHYLEETERVKILCLPEVKKSHLKKIIFDCFTGKKYIDDLKPDVVVSMQNIITFGIKCPQVLYIHQSIPFQDIKRFSFIKKEERSIALVQYVIGAFIKASAKRADYVFVQSKWMQEAVARKTGIPKNKICQAFPDVANFDVYEDDVVFNNRKFFYPTNVEMYKNVNLISAACGILNNRGITDFQVFLTIPQNPDIEHNSPNIECIGRIDKGKMFHMYKECTLLFPSLIETVGLPLLEARSIGTLILAADTPFAQECLEGYDNMQFFNAFDAFELAEKMEMVIKKQFVPQMVELVAHYRSGWEAFYNTVIGKNADYTERVGQVNE